MRPLEPWNTRPSARNLSDATAKRIIPYQLFDGTPLGKTTGPALDPIVSLRRTLRIPPGTTARVIFSTIIASTREQALELADKHRDVSNL